MNELDRTAVEGVVVERSPDQLAALIRDDLAGAVQGIVAAGHHLREARAVVNHGRWEDWLIEEVRIVPRYAQKLMSIVDNPGIVKSASDALLPASVEILAELSKLNPQVIEGAIESGEISPDMKLHESRALVSEHETTSKPGGEPVPPPDGKYRCIIIDPPWPMPKIERGVRENQYQNLDYRTLDIEEIADEAWVPVRTVADDDCHIYLWVTHRFLPDGMRLLEAWGFRYQCVMTWRKNVGITPYSWMYDTEHILFGHRGNLKLTKMGLRLSFDAPVQGHSVKPDVFYDRVREASPGPRLDMFPGVEHDGFEPWGLEVSHRDDI